MADDVDVAAGLETTIECRTGVVGGRIVEGMIAETGRADFSLLAGDSVLVGNVGVEAFFVSCSGARDVLEAFEMESRSLWNLRFVVLRAVGIFTNSLRVVKA